MLGNNEFIKYCSQIVTIILENVIEFNPESMYNNLEYIKTEKSKMFIKINDCNNLFLDEIIMNILERKIRNYFEYIPKFLKYNEYMSKIYI